MKKILLSGIAIALIASFAIYAQIRENRIDEDPQLAKWEKLAEQGDTAAMHRLIEFYDENSVECVEIEAACDAYGNELDADSINSENKKNAQMSKEYSERLNYGSSDISRDTGIMKGEEA